LLGHSTDILEKQLSGGIALPFLRKNINKLSSITII